MSLDIIPGIVTEVPYEKIAGGKAAFRLYQVEIHRQSIERYGGRQIKRESDPGESAPLLAERKTERQECDTHETKANHFRIFARRLAVCGSVHRQAVVDLGGGSKGRRISCNPSFGECAGFWTLV